MFFVKTHKGAHMAIKSGYEVVIDILVI